MILLTFSRANNVAIIFAILFWFVFGPGKRVSNASPSLRWLRLRQCLS